MQEFSLNPVFASTRMDPIAAHVAYLRHLVRPSVLEQLLRDRHGCTKGKSKALASDIAPFLDQALLFYDSSRNIPLRVRPVLQYYAYLNFAVATVLIYEPNGWQQYRKHGAEDLTKSLQRI